MKKVVFIQKDRGHSTPEQKAEALRRVGHLESIHEDPFTGNIIKYYTMAALHDYGLCAEVTISGGRVVSVRKVPESALKSVPPTTVPLFGGF